MNHPSISTNSLIRERSDGNPATQVTAASYPANMASRFNYFTSQSDFPLVKYFPRKINQTMNTFKHPCFLKLFLFGLMADIQYIKVYSGSA